MSEATALPPALGEFTCDAHVDPDPNRSGLELWRRGPPVVPNELVNGATGRSDLALNFPESKDD